MKVQVHLCLGCENRFGFVAVVAGSSDFSELPRQNQKLEIKLKPTQTKKPKTLKAGNYECLQNGGMGGRGGSGSEIQMPGWEPLLLRT